MPRGKAVKADTGPKRTLPSARFNTTLLDEEFEGATNVKFQVIRKDGQSIVVGRVKVPTPVGHSYVLRRYDTGALSLTTMWKAAYPTATTAQEKEETAWVKANFDLTGPPEKARLAGVWIPVPVAKTIAVDYSLLLTVTALSDAVPEAELLAYNQASDPVSEPVPATQPATKRRKASVPRSTDNQAGPKQTRASAAAANALPTPTTPGRVTRATKSPAPSSTRKTKSPAPSRTTPSRAAKGSKAVTKVEEPEPDVAGVDPEEDIAESKDLVSKLKAEINGTPTSPKTSGKRGKRAREEELPNGKSPIKLDLSVIPEEPGVTREIATNNRVNKLVRWPSMPSVPSLPTLQPNQKSAAWGTLAFALAVGATTFVPQFF